MISSYEFPLVLLKATMHWTSKSLEWRPTQQIAWRTHMLDFIFGIAFAIRNPLFSFLSTQICLFLVCLGTWRCHGSRAVKWRPDDITQLAEHHARAFGKSFRVKLDFDQQMHFASVWHDLRMIYFVMIELKLMKSNLEVLIDCKTGNLLNKHTRKRQFPISLDGNWSLLSTHAMIDIQTFIFNHQNDASWAWRHWTAFRTVAAIPFTRLDKQCVRPTARPDR